MIINGIRIIGKDVNGVCGRCKGKGYVNHIYANGVCFWCDGHKTVTAYKEHLSREWNKKKPKAIEHLQSEIATYESKLIAMEGKSDTDPIKKIYARRLESSKAKLEFIESEKK